jgi:hypothetical protein
VPNKKIKLIIDLTCQRNHRPFFWCPVSPIRR